MIEARSPKPAPSRLLRWAAVIGFLVPVALIAFAASPLGPNFIYVVVGIPALLFLWVIAGLAAFIVSIRAAMRREWRRCVIAAILPIVLLIVAFHPVRFVRSCDYLGDVIHFIAMRSYYDRQIAALPADQRPPLLVFDWGGMSFASHGLVYDQADQIALPRGSQSPDWLAKASHTELSCEGYGVRALWDHYYLVDFPC
jgi:hypothetical protein